MCRMVQVGGMHRQCGSSTGTDLSGKVKAAEEREDNTRHALEWENLGIQMTRGPCFKKGCILCYRLIKTPWSLNIGCYRKRVFLKLGQVSHGQEGLLHDSIPEVPTSQAFHRGPQLHYIKACFLRLIFCVFH